MNKDGYEARALVPTLLLLSKIYSKATDKPQRIFITRSQREHYFTIALLPLYYQAEAGLHPSASIHTCTGAARYSKPEARPCCDRMLCYIVDELTSSAIVVVWIEEDELLVDLLHMIMERICSLEYWSGDSVKRRIILVIEGKPCPISWIYRRLVQRWPIYTCTSLGTPRP